MGGFALEMSGGPGEIRTHDLFQFGKYAIAKLLPRKRSLPMPSGIEDITGLIYRPMCWLAKPDRTVKRIVDCYLFLIDKNSIFHYDLFFYRENWFVIRIKSHLDTGAIMIK